MCGYAAGVTTPEQAQSSQPRKRRETESAYRDRVAAHSDDMRAGGPTAVLVGTWGATFGHVLVRVRVVREDGGWAGPLRTLVRTLALCLVLPAVLTDATGRRFHDKWAGTVLARMGT
ncbi:MAG: hypothetical protein CSB46_02235 [Micrococcales bacterium]|nr:MAG: hypothetical protein CSB46_02235 [Micrococcales bacterium]